MSDDPPLDHSAFLAAEEEKEQTANWLLWMEQNKRRKKKVKLMKQKVLDSLVQAVEARPRAATSSSNPGASSSGTSGYGGDPGHRGAG